MQNHTPEGGGLFRAQSSLLRGPPVYEPRTPWSPGWALVATVAIVGLSIAASILLVMLLRGSGAVFDLGDPKNEAVAGAGALRLFALWQVGTVLLTLIASALFAGRVRDVLALGRAAGGWRSYVGAVLVLTVLQVALSAVQYATRSGDLYVDLRPFVDLVRSTDWLLAAAVIGIGAPLSEELLFRGFLLSALAQTRVGFWGAAFISTGLWTALHVGYTAVGVLEVFIIGLFFSWLLWRTGSLRVAIFCHAFYNSLIVLALRFVDLPAAG